MRLELARPAVAWRRLGPARAEEVRHEAKDVVVEHAAVDGEDAHQQQHVPAADRHGDDVVSQPRREGEHLRLVDAQIEGKGGDHRAVADVAKHDAEEEGEGDDSEGGRVDLAVPGHAVRVDDLLEGRGDLVDPEVGGRRLVRLEHVEDGRHVRARPAGRPPQSLLRLLDHGGGAPRLGYQDLAREVVVPQVERVVESLLPREVGPPRAVARRQRAEQRLLARHHVVDHVRELVEPGQGLREQRGALRVLCRVVVPVRAKRVRDLGHPREGLLSGEEDEEDRLVLQLLRLRVAHQLVDGRRAHEHVAARRAKQDPLERREPRGGEHPAHIAEPQPCRGGVAAAQRRHAAAVAPAAPPPRPSPLQVCRRAAVELVAWQLVAARLRVVVGGGVVAVRVEREAERGRADQLGVRERAGHLLHAAVAELALARLGEDAVAFPQHVRQLDERVVVGRELSLRRLQLPHLLDRVLQLAHELRQRDAELGAPRGARRGTAHRGQLVADEPQRPVRLVAPAQLGEERAAEGGDALVEVDEHERAEGAELLDGVLGGVVLHDQLHHAHPLRAQQPTRLAHLCLPPLGLLLLRQPRHPCLELLGRPSLGTIELLAAVVARVVVARDRHPAPSSENVPW
mmetsp:Transcript_36940/g.113333  ORF Transcript_36940/g.113333 Transcript_36940/m.113333 type:complete len:627 (+) Transcript_36940:721-2601(+)